MRDSRCEDGETLYLLPHRLSLTMNHVALPPAGVVLKVVRVGLYYEHYKITYYVYNVCTCLRASVYILRRIEIVSCISARNLLRTRPVVILFVLFLFSFVRCFLICMSKPNVSYTF